MKSNEDRRKDIFHGVLPPEGSEEFNSLIDYFARQRASNPQIKKNIEDNHKKAIRSFHAQYLSSCDYITEMLLRHYLNEFNYRAWNHGLRSMSVMFNVMEAFFIYRRPYIYFELIEEENYLISFFDFIDFVTSIDFENNKKLIEDNLTEDLIFNFNVGKDLNEIKFYSDDGLEFIVAGISIIRRGNEVTVLLTTGRNIKNDSEINNNKSKFEINNIDFDKTNPNKRSLLKDFQESAKGEKIEYEYIDEHKQFAKTIIAVRIDLSTNTIDARYIAREYNFIFDIVTDEIAGYLNEAGELKGEFKEVYEKGLKVIENYNAIMEVAKISLYLPYYLNVNEDFIDEELHETNFGIEYKNPIKQKEFRDTLGQKYLKKSLYIVNLESKKLPDIIKLRDDLFNIETSGYWKKLTQEDIGLDKNAKPIHGKTWVNKNISWFEAKNDELIVKKEAQVFEERNAGYIYILRNPHLGNNVFKIGLTTKEVNHRAEQLSKTSIPDKFYKVQEWNVRDCVKAEKEIHLLLKNYRIDPRREFFKIEYSAAVKIISEVIISINGK